MSGENSLPVLNVSRSEPLMQLATIAGVSSAVTIQAAQANSNVHVGGPGQLRCTHHTAVAVAHLQNLKPQSKSRM